MTAIFLGGQGIVALSKERLESLKSEAAKAPLKRARFCLHGDHADPVQEMVIAYHRDTYVRPHRHAGKSESFHLIDGELLVAFFDDAGRVIRWIRMGPAASGRAFLYRLSENWWHTTVLLTEYAVVHEIVRGPFVPGESEFAPWGPQEADVEGIKAFLDGLRKGVEKFGL